MFAPTKLPCTLMENYFTIMNIDIIKFEYNPVKRCLFEKNLFIKIVFVGGQALYC